MYMRLCVWEWASPKSEDQLCLSAAFALSECCCSCCRLPLRLPPEAQLKKYLKVLITSLTSGSSNSSNSNGSGSNSNNNNKSLLTYKALKNGNENENRKTRKQAGKKPKKLQEKKRSSRTSEHHAAEAWEASTEKFRCLDLTPKVTRRICVRVKIWMKWVKAFWAYAAQLAQVRLIVAINKANGT